MIQINKFTVIISVLVFVTLAGCGNNLPEPSPRSLSQETITSEGLVPLLSSSVTPEYVEKSYQSDKDNFLKEIAGVVALPVEEQTFTSVVVGLDRALGGFMDVVQPIDLLLNAHPDSTVRDAAQSAYSDYEKFFVDFYQREDVYQALKTAADKQDPLSDVDQKLLNDFLNTFIRNALALPPQQRRQFKAYKGELSDAEIEFAKNIRENKEEIWVTREQLAGMSDSYIQDLKQENGKYAITLKYPHYFPYMENGKDPELRKQLLTRFEQRGGLRNVFLLEQAISLRHKMANLLGYPTHAHFRIHDRMADSPETVLAFIRDLQKRVAPNAQKDFQILQQLKQQDLNDPQATLEAWDWRYYERKLKEETYAVDQEEIRTYFPFERVLSGLFTIYSTLFQVTFEEENNPNVWHPDVKQFAVKNKENETVAYFYMDLFPREGKYQHAAAFSLIEGRRLADGSTQKPIASIVANFTKPTSDKPSLLTHDEVETFFHEFGHIVHQVLTQSPYVSFAGTSVSRDFVEAPSQMLENWVWEKESLNLLSGHYLDPDQKLPDELIAKMLAAKNVNVAFRSMRQFQFGIQDMTYHTQEVVDSTEIARKTFEEFMFMQLPPDVYPQAGFGHLMGGYDAGYYGYMWSLVYAQDMFSRFEQEGILSVTTGLDFLKMILEPGGTRPAIDLIKAFLGREPNPDAFLKSIGAT